MLDLTGHKKHLLNLAKQAEGEWVKAPDGAEYAAAAQCLQGEDLVEMDAFRSPGISVRVVSNMFSA